MSRLYCMAVLRHRTVGGCLTMRPLTAWGVFDSEDAASMFILKEAWRITPGYDGWSVGSPIVNLVSDDMVTMAYNELQKEK